MDPVTAPTAWLRHERATRAAQLMVPLLLRVGDHDLAAKWIAWLLGLHETKPLEQT